jgi:hypothetical protein
MLGRGLIGVVLCVFPLAVFAAQPTVDEVQKATTVPNNAPQPTATLPAVPTPLTPAVPVPVPAKITPAPTVSPPLPQPPASSGQINNVPPQKTAPSTINMKKEQPQPTLTPPPLPVSAPVPPSGAVNQKKTLDEQWQAYFNDLRTCTAGTHTLTQIDPVTVSAYGKVVVQKIIAKEADRCHVTAILKPMIPGVPGQATPRIVAPNALDCHYTQGTILLVVNHFSNILQRMKNPASTFTNPPPKSDTYTKAVEGDCNVIVIL